MTSSAGGEVPDEGPGLYVHVPFCSAICPYCDFAVVVGSAAKRRAFVGHLVRELALVAGTRFGDQPFSTVYFGGGTPSLLGAEALAETLAAIRHHLDVADDARIHVEANPEDVDADALAAWRALGVSFLSLGVQRLDDAGLRFLGRRHDRRGAVRAVEQSLDAGFETVSVDLIYGLPDEPAATWRRALDRVVALGPQHLSCYQLTVEPRTPFGKRAARGERLAARDDDQARRFRTTHERLAAAGYDGYEVSNFARGTAHRSRHNRKYWHHVPYLGVGPSAHSFDGRVRWWNERHVTRWARRLDAGERPVAEREVLRDDQLAFEALMLGLRTRDGIDRAVFRGRFGHDPATDPGHLERLVRDGLLHVTASHLRPTLAGLAVAEALAASWPMEGGGK